MEELYEMVVKFFTTYGWQLGVIALSGIVLLGILKSFGVFNKIAPAKRKYVYVAVSVALSVAGCAAYLGIIGDFHWQAFLVMIPLVYSVNQVAYNVYENTGIRAAFRAIYDKIVDSLKKAKDKRLEDSAQKAIEQAAELDAKVKSVTTEVKKVNASKVSIQTASQEQTVKHITKKDI